jgi:hypothetical protein
MRACDARAIVGITRPDTTDADAGGPAHESARSPGRVRRPTPAYGARAIQTFVKESPDSLQRVDRQGTSSPISYVRVVAVVASMRSARSIRACGRARGPVAGTDILAAFRRISNIHVGRCAVMPAGPERPTPHERAPATGVNASGTLLARRAGDGRHGVEPGFAAPTRVTPFVEVT